MCLNGHFDTFCFDFTNVTKVTVRKYFSLLRRSQVLVCSCPGRPFGKGLWLWGEKVLVPNLFTLSHVQLFLSETIRKAGALQLPQFAVTPLSASQMGPLLVCPYRQKMGR